MSLPLTNVRLTTSLAAKISSTASSCTLNRSTDAEGTTFAGTYCLTFDEGTSKEEDMIVTLAGAAGTIVTRGLSKVDAVTLVTANRFEHDRGAEVKMTNNMLPRIIRRLNGAEAFDVADRPYLATDTNATDDKQFATRGEINRVAMGGVTTSRVIVIGTAGETVAAGNLVYLKAADGFWWKCDADTAATVDNTILGIAQGAGTAAASISGGVLLSGVDSNQSGMTIGATQYASNTAGAISGSAGTVEVTVGAARSATDLYFSPRYNQQITEDQQDALAGTTGTPSSTNKYVTADDADRNTSRYSYAASVVGTDAYAITLSPVLTAYAAGQQFAVLADVGNTGACTLNVNALGAKAIKTQDGSDPADGYVHANSLFTVRYDGTNMVLTSPNAVDTKPTKVVSVSASSAMVGTTAGYVFDAASGGVSLDFADGAQDQGNFTVVVPPNVTTLSAVSVLYARDATGNLYLYFTFGKSPIAGGAATSDVTDVLTTYAATAGGSNDQGLITVPAGAFNGLSTLAPGDIIGFSIYRDAADAADTYGATWKVFGVQFTFT